MISGNTVRLDFYSDFAILDFVQVVGDHIGRQAGLDDEALHWVGIAIRESVINAIKHGNAGDERKRVHLELTALDAANPGLAIRVRDEGAGFDQSRVADCCAPENLLKTSGRGLFLIRNYMDELKVQRAPEGGMEVLMVKRAKPQRT